MVSERQRTVVYIVDTIGVNLKESSYYLLLILIVGFPAKMLAQERYRLTGDWDRPLWLLFCWLWYPFVCLRCVFMAISLINSCLLSIFPLRFTKEDYVVFASGFLDFASCLGTGVSSITFGMMIERFGYGTMVADWDVLCGFATVLIRKKSRNNLTIQNRTVFQRQSGLIWE